MSLVTHQHLHSLIIAAIRALQSGYERPILLSHVLQVGGDAGLEAGDLRCHPSVELVRGLVVVGTCEM